MTTPNDILEGIAVALHNSGNLPSSTTYVTRQVDMDGAQAGLQMPIVELETQNSVRNSTYNTDLSGYATDDGGNRIGYIFRTRFDMTVAINVYTAEGGGYDPDDIGQSIRRALLKYDSHQMGSRWLDNHLPDGNGGTLDEVEYFYVGDGENNDDITTTPALRRWQQTIDLHYYDEINTAQEYGPEDFIKSVDITTDVDDSGSSTVADDGDLLIEYVHVDSDGDGTKDTWEIQITDQ